MIQLTKEQEPLYQQLKQIEKEMRNAVEQAKIIESSMQYLTRTIKKNELTIKQLQKVEGPRSFYVPLGRAFLLKDKESSIKEYREGNDRLTENVKDLQNKFKSYSQKANEKYKILKEGSDKLTKK